MEVSQGRVNRINVFLLPKSMRYQERMQTIVIGHKNPDMDSICSAIAYAEFKKATGANQASGALWKYEPTNRLRPGEIWL
jgi:c-di-AMP phosphodiesterase-like protein